MKCLFVIICCVASLSLFSQTAPDKYKKAPFFVSKSPDKLAVYLTKNDSSDYQKVLNIYTWVIHNIKYDLKSLKQIEQKKHTVKETLKRGKATGEGYSELYMYLCEKAGLKCQKVTGYSKGGGWHKEDLFYETDHAWNAVKIDSSWYLVDATWDAGKVTTKAQLLKKLKFKLFGKPYVKSKYKYIKDPQLNYFMLSPERFVVDHLPINPEWQLLKYPVSVGSYESVIEIEYSGMKDSLYPLHLDSSNLNYILNDYQNFNYDQYYVKTSKKSFDFNERNYAILGNSSYLKAQSFQYLSEGKEAISNYKEASVYYKRQIKLSKRGSSLTTKALKSNIKNDLRVPLNKRFKINEQMISKKAKSIDKFEKGLKKQEEALGNIYLAKEKKSNSLDWLTEGSKTELVFTGKLDSLRRYEDSVSTELDNIASFYSQVNDLNGRFLGDQKTQATVVKMFLKSVMEGYSYETKVYYADYLDSIGSMIDRGGFLSDSLNKEIRYSKRRISSYKREATVLITESKKLDTLNKRTELYLNEYQMKIYDWKIKLKEDDIQVQKELNSFNIGSHNNSIKIKKSLDKSLRLVSMYEDLRVNSVEFRRRKNEYKNKVMINSCNANISLLKQ